MKVKVIYMMNDYSWKKFEKEVSRREADKVSSLISRKLCKSLNEGRIKDYRVEYYSIDISRKL